MLIGKFTFQTDFLFYKKHTKCTLNLRSLDFPSADSSARKTVIHSSRANLSLDLLSFFPSKRQLSIFFNFHFSSVHFIGVFYRQERRFVEFTALAQFLGVHPRANGSGWLTNQSARFTFVMLQFMLEAPWRCTTICFLFTNCDAWINSFRRFN